MYQYFNVNISHDLPILRLHSLQTQHDSIANFSVCCLWFIYCRAVPTLTTTQSKLPQPRKQLTHSDMHRTSGFIPQTLLVRVWVHETDVYVRSCHQKKIVIERTRDLIYLKFVATDFFLKIISPSAGENSGDLA